MQAAKAIVCGEQLFFYAKVAINTAQLRSSMKLRYRAQWDEFVFLIELVIGDRLYDHDLGKVSHDTVFPTLFEFQV